MKKTPLYDEHVKLGAKMTEFGGFMMPIEYAGLSEEHHCVRTSAGFFDVSHMGEIQVKGEEATSFLNALLSNDIEQMQDFSTQYHFMLNEEGNIIDDLIAYRTSSTDYLLVVNASNLQKDREWIIKKSEGYKVQLTDLSEQIGMIALQGPLAVGFLSDHSKDDIKSIKKFDFASEMEVFGEKVMLSRTGYTGEDGFEIYAAPDAIVRIWHQLLAFGKEKNIVPAGLGCRDTLRFQAGLPLYGNELSEEINPYEANLGMFVKLDKSEFIGQKALKKKKEAGIQRKIVAFKMHEKVIPRHGYEVFYQGEKIGFVTTGYMLPDNKKSVGFAMVEISHTNLGDEFEIQIRKHLKPASVIHKKEFKSYE